MKLDNSNNDDGNPYEPQEVQEQRNDPKKKNLTEQEIKIEIEKGFTERGYIIDPELVDIINTEGDFEEWTDPYSNYLCRISRLIQMQFWNGYVRIPENHPCFGKRYDDIEDIDVHGGLTYGGDHFPSYTNRTKEDAYWWFGFDCGHAYDRIPRIHSPFHYRFEQDVYRDKDYVKNEVTKLAKQFKDMEIG